MYPVVIGNGRSMTTDTIIGGYHVPKGVSGGALALIRRSYDRFICLLARAIIYKIDNWPDRREWRASFIFLEYKFLSRSLLSLHDESFIRHETRARDSLYLYLYIFIYKSFLFFVVSLLFRFALESAISCKSRGTLSKSLCLLKKIDK